MNRIVYASIFIANSFIKGKMKGRLILFLLLCNTIIFAQESNTKDWKSNLNNLRVTHITSENSLSSDYTSKTQAYLCANGYLYMSVIDNYSKSEFEGFWVIENKSIAEPAVLTVTFNDGDIKYYTLKLINQQLYIDGDLFQYEYTTQCN